MLRVNNVTISGFKSYAQEHHIGPFSPRITLLIGRNGSGKSSLLEAISFVLGSDSVTLRSNNLRNLIARGKSDETYCSVTLHCSITVKADEIRSEIGNLDVTRRIDKRGTSKYFLRVNDGAENTIKFDELQSMMRQYGVDMSLSERFIIRQHNTVQLAQKNVLEMLEYLELQMGTKELRDEITSKLTALFKEIDTIRSQEGQVTKEIERLKPVLDQLHEYNAVRGKIDKAVNKMSVVQLRLVEYEEKELGQELEGHNNELQKIKKEKKRIEKLIAADKTALKDLSDVLSFADVECQKIKEVLTTNGKNRAVLKARRSKLESMIGADNVTAENMLEEINELASVISEKAPGSSNEKTAMNSLKKLRGKQAELLFQCEQNIPSMLVQYNELKPQLLVAASENTPKELQEAKASLIKELQQVEKAIAEDRCREISLSERKITLEAVQKQSLKQQKDRIERELEQNKRLCADKQRQINSLNKNSSMNAEKDQKMIHDLKSLSNGVLGFVKDLLTIIDDKNYVPIMNILSAVRNHVVVRSRSDARLVINYYEKNRIGTVTCQILEESHSVNNAQDKLDDNLLLNAMKVVDFNEELRPLYTSLLSHWYIVEDKHQALQHSFDPATKRRRNVVTMGGHLFKADGEILPQRVFQNKNDRESKNALRNIQNQLKASIKQQENLISEHTSVFERINANKKEGTEIIESTSEVMKRLSALAEKKETISDALKDTEMKIDEFSGVQLAHEKFKELASHKLIKKLFQVELQIKSIEEKERQQLKEKKEVTKLKAKVDSLKKKHDRISHEISRAKQEIEEVDEQNKAIEKELKKAKKIKNQYEKERREKQEEFDQLTSANNERKREISSLVKQSISVEARINELNSQSNDLSAQKKELQKRLKDVMDTEDTNDFDISRDEYKRKIKRIEMKLRDLKKVAENMAADDQLDLEANEKHDRLLQKLNELKKLLENLQRQARDLQGEISRLEDDRYKIFCSFVDKINTSLSEIYHKLTIYGDCYLGFTEDKKALFESGVWFQVKPDRNQWRPFSDLSGGQKAVAEKQSLSSTTQSTINFLLALALSLSINEVFPSAIYLFDEIDASLDVGAVGRVARYLQQLSRSNSSQFIIISHRIPFIQLSNTLIGVYQIEGESNVAVFDNSEEIEKLDL